MKYLSPLTIAKLKGSRLTPKRLSSALDASGSHKIQSRGFSRDFFQHRPYVPGDDIRALDWKAYARMDRFYVREFEAENQFSTYIILDYSKSMAFQSEKRDSKWDYACRLALALSYLTIAQGDAAGLIALSGETQTTIPPRSVFSHLELMDSSLSRLTPQGLLSPRNALPRILPLIKRRSLVIVISDLMGETENFLEGIGALKTGRNEVAVFQTLDPRERDLSFEFPAILRDLENGEEIPIDNQDFRECYVEEWDRQLRIYQSAFHQKKIAHRVFFTNQALEISLAHFLEQIR